MKREMLNPIKLPYKPKRYKQSETPTPTCQVHRMVSYPKGKTNARGSSPAGSSRVGVFCLIRMEGEKAILAAPGRCGCDKDHFVVDAWEVG
jgi:hypothetical protein